jgi:hypothetical protein
LRRAAGGVVQSQPAMKLKALRFLPLAFLAGTHGFALFAPYVGVILAALHLRSRQRQWSKARAKFATAAPAAAVDPVDDALAPAAL